MWFLSASDHAWAETRSQLQKPAHKNLGRNDQRAVIAAKATYAPVSYRAGSRSYYFNCSPDI